VLLLVLAIEFAISGVHELRLAGLLTAPPRGIYVLGGEHVGVVFRVIGGLFVLIGIGLAATGLLLALGHRGVLLTRGSTIAAAIIALFFTADGAWAHAAVPWAVSIALVILLWAALRRQRSLSG
jgi:hypothetical protein